MKLEPIEQLRPDPLNPREIGEHEAAALRASLEEYGAVEPAVVNADGTIIGGHQRVEAAKQLGWAEFPVVRVDLPDDKARLLNLALNRIHGEWAEDKLALLLAELAEQEADLGLSGFDSAELDRLFGSLESEEEIPEPQPPPAVPVSEPGDLICLGEHRLLCGDATEPADLERLLEGELAQMVLADPPYNVAYTGGSTNKATRPDSFADSRDDYSAWLARALRCGLAGSDEAAALHLWFGTAELRAVLAALDAAGWEDRNLIIWNKLNAHYGALGAQYKLRYEPFFYAHHRGHSPRWFGASNEPTVWDEEQPHVNDLIPTMKPVALYERSLRNHTERGDLVLELFGGSGPALIAAERLERRCAMLELDPGYCDVIVSRWEQYTGKEAVRGRQTAETYG